MVRGKKEGEADDLERKRVKKLAVSNILSNTPPNPYSSLPPSKTLIKHHGKDIIRKSQRKNKFLFSFPALLAPISGGKIGELTNLASKNPLLYLHFPQGRMKLFGTIVYPENRYLTLQFSRGGKSVMCEDYFDNMIVFSEAWWIGTKEENPEEARLDFPKELSKAPSDQYDFKGGAGGTSVNKLVGKKSKPTTVEVDSPESELETDSSDDKTNLRDLKDVTPSRQSARMAGKKFKFTEASSGDDSLESDDETFQKEEKKDKISSARVLNIDNVIASTLNHSEEDQSTATVSKRRSESSVNVAASKEESHSNHGSLVQATISSLFKKAQEKENVEEKKAPITSRKSSLSKDSDQMQRKNLKRKTDKVEGDGSNRKTKVAKGDKTGPKTKTQKKENEEDQDDDDMEDFSSSSEDNNEGSDEDWEA